MLTNNYFLTNLQNKTSVFSFGIQVLQGEIVFCLEVILEIIAILIIALAVWMALQKLFKHISRGRNYEAWELIRLEFGLLLSISLEFLLAADIVATASSPTWNAIGKLGAVAGIRTFLNFFLQKEVERLEDRTQQTTKILDPEQKVDIFRQFQRSNITATKRK